MRDRLERPLQLIPEPIALHQPAGAAMLRHRCEITRDDRDTARLRLDQRDPKPLTERRHTQHVKRVEHTRHRRLIDDPQMKVQLVAVRKRLPRDIHRLRKLHQVDTLVVTEDVCVQIQDHIIVVPAEMAERLEHLRERLPGWDTLVRADHPHNERIRGNLQLSPDLRLMLRRRTEHRCVDHVRHIHVSVEASVLKGFLPEPAHRDNPGPSRRHEVQHLRRRRVMVDRQPTREP